MEKNMSNTDDTPKLYHAQFENRVLADSELDAVTGGGYDLRKGGAIIIYDYQGSVLRESTIHPA